MARIVLAPFGSLGDIHPMIALALELRRRGHTVVFCTMEFYREKMGKLGFEFYPIRPSFDPDDRELVAKLLDLRKGPENMIKQTLFPVLRDTYDDLMKAVEGADLFITGEVIYPARSVAEKSGVKWASMSLSPISLLSSYDPNIYPTAELLEYVRFLPQPFHKALFSFMRWTISDWFEPYKDFRRSLGLDENHDPIFYGKASELLHLVMFSKVLSAPQPDWYTASVQTGFCFYDGQDDLGKIDPKLAEFLDRGEPPVVFTLGSAAVMDAGNFYEESIKAAKILNRRAVMLYGMYNTPPAGLAENDENIVGFEYAPYSQIFPKAACVVHQGGIGTTSQVLRAGVPMLVMPYAHDQPDNAARCRRIGVGRVVSRNFYTAEIAAAELRLLLLDPSYRDRAQEVKNVIDSENGTPAACDAIEAALQK